MVPEKEAKVEVGLGDCLIIKITKVEFWSHLYSSLHEYISNLDIHCIILYTFKLIFSLESFDTECVSKHDLGPRFLV